MVNMETDLFVRFRRLFRVRMYVCCPRAYKSRALRYGAIPQELVLAVISKSVKSQTNVNSEKSIKKSRHLKE